MPRTVQSPTSTYMGPVNVRNLFTMNQSDLPPNLFLRGDPGEDILDILSSYRSIIKNSIPWTTVIKKRWTDEQLSTFPNLAQYD